MCFMCGSMKSSETTGATCVTCMTVAASETVVEAASMRPPRDSYRRSVSSMEPTDASPGSEAKIMVMRARAMMGVSLFHPLDNMRRSTKAADDEMGG